MNTGIETSDIIGDEHIGTSLETPVRKDTLSITEYLYR